MATVTGFTAARMLEIENNSVVDGAVDGNGNLILTRHDGTPINAGNVKGPKGDPGTGGGDPPDPFEITFTTPSLVWVCDHNLGYSVVDVITFDNNGNEIQGDVVHLSDNSLEVRWYYETSGSAHIKI